VFTLKADSSRRSLAVLALVVALLTAWIAWFAGARVAVYAVSDSARLQAIVPEGILKIVALFQPSEALGRVRPGQPARVRFDGFPWTQYGSTPARVSNVAAELRDGRIRVELTFDAGALTTIPGIPYQHGLTALVDVEIERVSPATLVLRSAGVWTHERAAPTPIAP
jgi:membrane fusion protein (multidrug efflux system)